MSVISTAVLSHSPSAGVPLLAGLRRGGRAFAQEVSASVPLLQRRTSAQRRSQEPTGSAGMHLTRRGRLLLIGLPTMLGVLAAAAVLLALLAPSHVTAGTETPQGPGVEAVTVQPGQSLWEVAQTAEPQRDTRDVVARIVELNDLDSAQISSGQQILVPAA